MHTQAAVLYDMGQPAPYAESAPLHVETVTLNPPGAGEVLVEVPPDARDPVATVLKLEFDEDA